MKCRLCGADSESSVLFGIIEKWSSESNPNSPKVTRQPVGIASMPYCQHCVGAARKKQALRNLIFSLIFLAVVIGIVFLFMELRREVAHGARLAPGAPIFLTVILLFMAAGFLLNGVLFFVALFAKGTDFIETSGLRTYLKADLINDTDVVAPVKGQEITLPVSADAQGLRDQGLKLSLEAISQNVLEKYDGTLPGPASTSPNYALLTLKYWYHEYIGAGQH